jgi:serine/threonine-protein kinase
MDLKPENVMVGTFGEVYVMDWGVALSLHADDAPRIPVARETHEILGTPSYLAPEVLEGDGTRLGVWTDVFLLGGLLHEIVTGRPPHRGETMMAVVHDILERDPQIDDARWPGLAAIANRAMQRDPALRHPNVESVRQDMERYLRRRDAERLCEDAERRAAGFLRDVEAAPPEATAWPEETSHGTYTDDRSLDEIHTQFGAIRFGYLAALERWPELESARRGLTEVTERLVSFELARGRVDAAATALASLPVVDEALRLRVEEARREHASRQRALEALASDHDPKAGQRTRLFVASVLAVTWTLLPLGAWIAGVTAADQPAELVIGIAAVDLVVVLGLLYWARESMTKSSINRGLAGTLVLVLVAQVVLGILSIQVGLTPSQLHVVTLFLWTVAVAFVSVFVDPRFWVTTYVFAAGLAVVAAIPDTLTLVATVTNFALFLGILRIWWMPLEALRR